MKWERDFTLRNRGCLIKYRASSTFEFSSLIKWNIYKMWKFYFGLISRGWNRFEWEIHRACTKYIVSSCREKKGYIISFDVCENYPTRLIRFNLVKAVHGWRTEVIESLNSILSEFRTRITRNRGYVLLDSLKKKARNAVQTMENSLLIFFYDIKSRN